MTPPKGVAQADSAMDKALCRHLFNDMVVCIARLASYSTSRNLALIGDGEHHIRAKDLCKKDLLILAISIRKLAEMAELTESLKGILLEIVDNTVQDENLSSRSCWDLMGNIIHGVEIEILKEHYPLGRLHISAYESRVEIDAAVSVKSDKYPLRIFRLTDLVRIANKFSELVDYKLSEHGIYLSSSSQY